MMRRRFLIGLLWTALLIAPWLNAVVVRVGPVAITLGVFVAAIAYGTVDVLANAYGKAPARQAVALGVLLRLGVYLLAAAAFGTSPRMILALTVSMYVSQSRFAIPFFLWLKTRMRSAFWTRYNLTAIPGQTLAMLIWVPLAFYGTRPLLPLLTGSFLLRVALAITLTPLFAALARWAR